MIDRYAGEKLAEFREVLQRRRLDEIGQFCDLLDQPLQHVTTFSGLTERRIRVVLCHENCVILGTHSRELIRIDLTEELIDQSAGTCPDFAWSMKDLDGRVLSACIAEHNGQPRLFAGLETGHCAIVDLSSGELINQVALVGNIISCTAIPDDIPSASPDSGRVVLCAHDSRHLFFVNGDGIVEKKYYKVFEEAGGPRSCFFSRHAGRTDLCVLTDSGALVRLSLDIKAKNQISLKRKSVDDVVPDGATVLTFAAELLSDDEDVKFAVTAQAPAVAGVFTSRGSEPTQKWSHYSDEVCFFAKYAAAPDILALGSRNGDIQTYASDGTPLALASVTAPARAADTFRTKQGQSGFVVAHGLGELTVFWIPEVCTPGGLLSEVLAVLSPLEIRSLLEVTPSITLLRWVAEADKMDDCLPDTLRWPVPRNLFPGFIGVLQEWLTRRPKDHNRLWRLLEEWIPLQQMPRSVAVFCEEWRGRVMGQLRGMRRRFDEMSSNLRPDPDYSDGSELNQIEKAIEAFGSDRGRCAELLSDCIEQLQANPEAEIYYDRIATMSLYSAVEGIINARDNADRAAILLNDGTVFELYAEQTVTSAFDPSRNLVLRRVEITGHPTRVGGVCVTRRATICVSPNGWIDIVPVNDEPARNIKITESAPLSATALNDVVYVGTVWGKVFRIPAGSMTPELFWTSPVNTPIMSMTVGHFRIDGESHLAAFQEHGGLHFLSVDGRVQPQDNFDNSKVRYFPDQVVTCDVDGDQLDDAIYLDPHKSLVRYILWSRKQEVWNEKAIEHPGTTSIGLLNLARNDHDDKKQVIFGTSDGKIFRVNGTNPKPVPVAVSPPKTESGSRPDRPKENGTRENGTREQQRITGVGWIPSPIGNLLITASNQAIEVYRPHAAEELQSYYQKCRSNTHEIIPDQVTKDISDLAVARRCHALNTARKRIHELLNGRHRKVLVLKSIAGAGKCSLISALVADDLVSAAVCRVQIDGLYPNRSDFSDIWCVPFGNPIQEVWMPPQPERSKAARLRRESKTFLKR